MTRSACLLAALLAACAEDSMLVTDVGSQPELDTGAAAPLDAFLLSVEPAAGGPVPELLPGVFGPFTAGNGFSLELRKPVKLSGTLIADRITPWLAGLPSEAVPVEGTVYLFGSDGSVAASAPSNAAGEYALSVVPDVYVIGVTPEDPRIAARSDLLIVNESARYDLHIDAGAPIWGRVLDGNGAGVSDADVWAVNTVGLSSAHTRTDGQGWYELRVEPESWSVLTSGRTIARDPTLTSEPVDASTGARVDLAFARVPRATVGLRVLDPQGRSLSGALVRLTSRRLTSYSAKSATFRVDLLTDSRGDVLTNVPAGSYQIEVLPSTDEAFSPWTRAPVAIAGDSDLGTVRLEAFATWSGVITDLDGAFLDGAAIKITERTSQPRTWHVSSVDGLFSIDVPTSELEIVAQPPGDRRELAVTRSISKVAALDQALTLGPGEAIGGRVTWRGPNRIEPLPFTVVRVLDGDRQAWGYALTDEDGAFEVYVDRSAMQPLVDDTGL